MTGNKLVRMQRIARKIENETATNEEIAQLKEDLEDVEEGAKEIAESLGPPLLELKQQFEEAFAPFAERYQTND